MSNYILGSLKINPNANINIETVISEIQKKSCVGFHCLPSIKLNAFTDDSGEENSMFRDEIFEYLGHSPSDKDNQLYFYISDGNETYGSEYLMLELDWAEGCAHPLPDKLEDRLCLISEQIHMMFAASQTSLVHLWPSVCDILEGTTSVRLSEFLDVLRNDFANRGIPCMVYKITP
jgi:hypothetical protein